MQYLKYIFCFLAAGIISVAGYCQSSLTDSLKNRLQSETQDTNKIFLAIELCKVYNNKDQYNDAVKYGKQAIELAEKLEKSDIAKLSDFAKKADAKASINLGNSYEDIADYSNALAYYTRGLKLKEELGDKLGMDHATNNIGLVYENQGDYPTALDYFFKSLNLSIAIKDSSGILRAYNNIGVIYLNEGNNDEAINYFRKSLKICESMQDKSGMADAYTNIGQRYQNANKLISALDCYKKSLALRQETQDLDGMALAYNNLGVLYVSLVSQPDTVKKRLINTYYSNVNPPPSLGDVDLMLMDSSLALHQKALEISQKINDKYKTVLALEGIGDLIKQRGQYSSALYYFRQGAAMAKQINAKLEYYNMLHDISQCYEKSGKADSALFYYEQAMAVKDSIFNSEKQKEIGREEAKFEYEKKQAIAEAETKRKFAIAAEQHKRQQLIIYTGLAGFIMLGFFSFFIAQRLKITRQQKSIIEDQKGKLDKAFLQLEDANQLLEEKHKDLTDSIQYASRIQTALLTTDHYLGQHLGDYFILFKPRDIVSGDFYWALEHNGILYLACCDCTGHGVPGAFMSLLNITFLHQAVIEKRISQPDKIFENIRTSVIESLNPDGSTDTKDGMDAVLCAFDFEKNMLSAACANNPLWIIRNGELIEFKADKIPIGEGNESRAFTLHETALHKGDCIYMFSDGYADQFGGPNGKKYKQAQLKELLLSVHTKPMGEQKNILEKTFNEWKGNLDQVDDICVMGLRI